MTHDSSHDEIANKADAVNKKPEEIGILETIEGDLRAYKQLVRGSFQHVDELQNARRTDESLRVRNFYTADGQVYYLDNGKVMLAMTREAHNPVLKYLDDVVDASGHVVVPGAFTQLVQTGNFHASQADLADVLQAEDTEVFDLSQLRLRYLRNNYSYIFIGTSSGSYDNLNQEQRRLAERVYGKGQDFIQNMKMLRDEKITDTGVFVLKPEYVKARLTELNHGKAESDKITALYYASWLGSFDCISLFIAYIQDIYGHSSLRGVCHTDETIKKQKN